jgi:transcriptional regulator with XRE-family HTH domain
VSERPIPVTDEQRANQRKALKALWDASGMDLTPLASKIGVSASTLSRYLSAETILPSPYYQPFAHAFGITRSDLIARLGLLDAVISDGPDYDFLDELRRVLPGDPDLVEHYHRKYVGAGAHNQRLIIEVIEDQAAVDAGHTNLKSRAIAEKRAQYTA